MMPKTISIPLSLALDRTAPSTLVHLCVVLATIADQDGFVRESQTSLASRLKITQEELVPLLASLKERGMIVVSKDDMGYLYQLSWVERRNAKLAAKPTTWRWVQVVERGQKAPSWMHIENCPEDIDVLKAWLEGKGHQFIKVRGFDAPKAPS